MPNTPNATPYLKSVEEITELMVSSLPQGYLYKNNEGIRQILEGFSKTYFEIAQKIQKAFEDLFEINVDNQFLDKFLGEYGLPNVIFPSIENNEQAVFAISMMRASKDLVSLEDFENFLALLGLNVEFFHYQNSLHDHYFFPYTLPMILGGVAPKNKITWLVYINETFSSEANLGVPTPMILYNSSVNSTYVKNILDYLKPDYIIFKYITKETKDLYFL
jgi:hypothetical protein